MATEPTAPYQRLRAWQASYRLAVEVYKVSRGWPRDERYGLTAQVRSAAYSIPANIAEGCAREGPREFHRFLAMALGSIAELHCGLSIAREIGLFDDTTWGRLEELRQKAGQLTGALAKAIRRQR